jgi:hypothetical protein
MTGSLSEARMAVSSAKVAVFVAGEVERSAVYIYIYKNVTASSFMTSNLRK